VRTVVSRVAGRNKAVMVVELGRAVGGASPAVPPQHLLQA
jgi:hypothetical protein